MSTTPFDVEEFLRREEAAERARPAARDTGAFDVEAFLKREEEAERASGGSRPDTLLRPASRPGEGRSTARPVRTPAPVRAESTRTTPPAPRTETPGKARALGRGLAESGYATAEGLERIDAIIDRNLGGDAITRAIRERIPALAPHLRTSTEREADFAVNREQMREFYGEPETTGEQVAAIGGRIVGDLAQFMAPGAAAAKVGALPAVASTGLRGIGARAALGTAASAPITVAQAAGSPEASTTGFLAEMTGNPTLQRAAGTVGGRVAGDIALDLAAGGILEGLVSGVRAANTGVRRAANVGDYSAGGLSAPEGPPLPPRTRTAPPEATQTDTEEVLALIDAGSFGVRQYRDPRLRRAAEDLVRRGDVDSTPAGLVRRQAPAADTPEAPAPSSAPTPTLSALDVAGRIRDRGERPTLRRVMQESGASEQEAREAIRRVREGGDTPEPAAVAPGAVSGAPGGISGVEGRESTLTFADGGKIPVRYRVVEADAVRPSHNPVSFQRNSEYPEGVQGRDYDRDTAAQERVAERTTGFDPDRLLDPTGLAASGPPVVTRSGVAVAGNERTMLRQRLPELNPEADAAYRSALETRAAEYGIDPETVRGMRRPVLVREIADDALDTSDPDVLRSLNTRSDMEVGKTKDALSDAATRARGLPQGQALRHFAQTFGEEDTLSTYLRGPSGRRFVQELVADGAISRGEIPRYVSQKTGALTDEGQALVQRVMSYAAVGDNDILSAAPASLLQKLEGAIPDVVRAAQVPGWDLSPALRSALQLHIEKQANGFRSIDDLLANGDLFDRNPQAGELARFLERANRKQVREVLSGFAREAEEARRMGESVDMFGDVPRTPETAFEDRFRGVPTATTEQTRPSARPVSGNAQPVRPPNNAENVDIRNDGGYASVNPGASFPPDAFRAGSQIFPNPNLPRAGVALDRLYGAFDFDGPRRPDALYQTIRPAVVDEQGRVVERGLLRARGGADAALLSLIARTGTGAAVGGAAGGAVGGEEGALAGALVGAGLAAGAGTRAARRGSAAVELPPLPQRTAKDEIRYLRSTGRAEDRKRALALERFIRPSAIKKVVFRGDEDVASFGDMFRADRRRTAGFYFTEDATLAADYVEKPGHTRVKQGGVTPVYLRVTNPIDAAKVPRKFIAGLKKLARAEDPSIQQGGENFRDTYMSFRDFLWRVERDKKYGWQGWAVWVPDHIVEAARKMGYDGIRHDHGITATQHGVRHSVWIVFESGQIKSAIGNTGAYDPANPSILGGAPQQAVDALARAGVGAAVGGAVGGVEGGKEGALAGAALGAGLGAAGPRLLRGARSLDEVGALGLRDEHPIRRLLQQVPDGRTAPGAAWSSFLTDARVKLMEAGDPSVAKREIAVGGNEEASWDDLYDFLLDNYNGSFTPAELASMVDDPAKARSLVRMLDGERPVRRTAEEWSDWIWAKREELADSGSPAFSQTVRQAGTDEADWDALDDFLAERLTQPVSKEEIAGFVGSQSRNVNGPTPVTLRDPSSFVLRESGQSAPRIQEVRNRFPEGDYPPIVAIRETGEVVDGHHRVLDAQERGFDIAAVDISKQEFDKLKDRGFDDIEISWAALQRVGEDDAARGLDAQFPGAAVRQRGEEALDLLEEIEETLAIPLSRTEQHAQTVVNNLRARVEGGVASVDEVKRYRDANALLTRNEPMRADDVARATENAGRTEARDGRVLDMFDRTGAAPNGVVSALARGGAGAALGVTQGETPQERLTNAALMAAVAAGAPKVRQLFRGMDQIGAVGPRDAQGRARFFSRLEQAIASGQRRASAEQWLGYLDGYPGGIARGEREFTGIDDFLRQRAREGKPVTKEELAFFQRENRIELDEVVHRGTHKEKIAAEQAAREKQRIAREKIKAIRDEAAAGRTEEFRDLLRLLDEAAARTGDSSFDWTFYIPRTKRAEAPKEVQALLERMDRHEEYEMQFQPALDAAERELQEATREWERAYDYIPDSRYAKYTLPGGTNYRELLLTLPYNHRSMKSFRGGHWNEPNVLAHVRLKDRVSANGEKVLFVEEIQSDWHQQGREHGYASVDDSDRGTKVPDAPFKGTDEWAGLALKRILDEAAEGGYDRVAWTTGAQQTDRYDLAHTLSEVRYSSENEHLRAFDPEGQMVLDLTVPKERIGEYIGEEAAERLLQSPAHRSDADFELRGEELRSGGTGMIEFYDRMLPKLAEKYVRRLGGKIEPVEIHIDTDKTRTRLVYRGPEITDERLDAFAAQLREEAQGSLAPTADAALRQEMELEERMRAVLPSQRGDLLSVHVEDLYNRTRGTSAPKDLAHRIGGDNARIERIEEAVGETSRNLSLRVTPELRKTVQERGQPLYTFPGPLLDGLKTTLGQAAAAAGLGAAVDRDNPLRGALVGAGATLGIRAGMIAKTARRIVSAQKKGRLPQTLASLSDEEAERIAGRLERFSPDASAAVREEVRLRGERDTLTPAQLADREIETLRSGPLRPLGADRAPALSSAERGGIVEVYRGAGRELRHRIVDEVEAALENAPAGRRAQLEKMLDEMDAEGYTPPGLPLGPANPSIDPSEYANVAKFSLDPAGERRLNDQMRRVVEVEGLDPKRKVSWEETRQIARDIGLSASDVIARMGKAGGISGAEALAIRNVVKENIEGIEYLSRKLAQMDGLDTAEATLERQAMQQAIEAAESQNAILLNRFTKARTAAGRDLNAYKILANQTMDPVVWRARVQKILAERGELFREMEHGRAIQEIIDSCGG